MFQCYDQAEARGFILTALHIQRSVLPDSRTKAAFPKKTLLFKLHEKQERVFSSISLLFLRYSYHKLQRKKIQPCVFVSTIISVRLRCSRTITERSLNARWVDGVQWRRRPIPAVWHCQPCRPRPEIIRAL